MASEHAAQRLGAPDLEFIIALAACAGSSNLGSGGGGSDGSGHCCLGSASVVPRVLPVLYLGWILVESMCGAPGSGAALCRGDCAGKPDFAASGERRAASQTLE